MSERVVRKGDTQAFLEVCRADLPLDRNLDDACFEYCDLSGLSLARFTLRGATFYRCLAKRLIFPLKWERMENFYSHCHYEGGDPRPYEGARIPADRPMEEQHDLVVEILLQGADKLQGKEAYYVRSVADILKDYEHGCYEAGMKWGRENIKDVQRIVAVFGPIFAPYPNLLRGFSRHLSSAQPRDVRRDR